MKLELAICNSYITFHVRGELKWENSIHHDRKKKKNVCGKCLYHIILNKNKFIYFTTKQHEN
jgi:hypothetical protein